MSKRQMQEKQHGEEGEREVAKSRPARNLVALTLNRSSQKLNSRSVLHSPENTGASCSSLDPQSTGRPVASVSDDEDPKVSSELCVTSHQALKLGTPKPWETYCVNGMKIFENLREDVQLTQVQRRRRLHEDSLYKTILRD